MPKNSGPAWVGMVKVTALVAVSMIDTVASV